MRFNKSKRPEQAYLRKRNKEIASEKPSYGYRRIAILIRREGLMVNTKGVYRIYREEGLQMRKKVPKRRVSPQLRQVRVTASRQNQCWSMDFVSDSLYNGQKLRCLTIVDNHTRICPAINVGFRYTACNVIDTLNLAVERYGKPECIRVDNRPEFISRELDLWAYARGVQLDFSRPGKPMDNSFIVQSPCALALRDMDTLQGASFNSQFRQECLNQHWFLSLEDAQAKIKAWWKDYNEVSPHNALGDITPHSFAAANSLARQAI